MALGRKTYNERCYYCHGYNGDAATLASTYLTPQPLDFSAADANHLTQARMIGSVTDGRPGTAMNGYAQVLSAREIDAVVKFVRERFMIRRAANTRYHTAENGWPDHERYAPAFPFARGEIALDSAWEALNGEQRAGRRLFMSACITCHDHGRVANPGAVWEARAVSYPRGHYRHDAPAADAVSGATPYARHDIVPLFSGLTPLERRGEALFQQNCAFCHAADGTGRNWIGRFLRPHPRDLTSADAMAGMTPGRLKTAINEGVVDSAMPAWRAVLQEHEVDAIVAYITRVFYPVGRDDGEQP